MPSGLHAYSNVLWLASGIVIGAFLASGRTANDRRPPNEPADQRTNNTQSLRVHIDVNANQVEGHLSARISELWVELTFSGQRPRPLHEGIFAAVGSAVQGIATRAAGL